jgi:hypothetical protein
MRSISLPRPSAAFALAFVALLVALGGTGYAAATISGKSIKAHTITGSKLVNNTLGGLQVNESRLGPVPLAFSAKTADSADTAKTADTATTAKSADTATTADKAKDADKLGGRTPAAYLRSARTVRFSTIGNVAAGTTVELQTLCNADEVATGGGGGWFILGTDTSVATATLSVSIPVDDPATGRSGFRMEGKNTSPVARDARAYAVCMSVG